MIIEKGFRIVSFVIMPNHIHLIVLTPMQGETVNRLVGNGKRFMAYEIVKRLHEKKQSVVLDRLKNAVTVSEKARGKLHKVFRESFDAKLLTTDAMIQQKMNYIHNNPVAKNWTLVKDRADYKHSSAAFYDLGIEQSFRIANINELSDAK